MAAPNEKPAVQGGQSEAAQQELFERAPFSPVWPSPTTLAARALGMLLTGQRITHPDFQAATRSWRLGAAIFELRRMGWPVFTFDENGQPITGRNHAIAGYELPGYALQAVGACA